MSRLLKPEPQMKPAWVCVLCGHVWLVVKIATDFPPQCPKCRKRHWHVKPEQTAQSSLEDKKTATAHRILDDENATDNQKDWAYGHLHVKQATLEHDAALRKPEQSAQPKKKSGAIHCIFNGRSGSEWTYCGKAYTEVQFVEIEESEKTTCKTCLRIMGSGPSANRKCGAAQSSQINKPVTKTHLRREDDGWNSKWRTLCSRHADEVTLVRDGETPTCARCLKIRLERPVCTHFCKTCNQPCGAIHMRNCPDHEFVALT